MALLDLSPKRQDFKWARGDTWQVKWIFEDENGAVIDLSGSTWLMQVREGSPDGDLFGTFTINTAEQASGAVYAYLADTVTDDADPDVTYWYDLEQTRSGEKITPVHGKIFAEADVSRGP